MTERFKPSSEPLLQKTPKQKPKASEQLVHVAKKYKNLESKVAKRSPKQKRVIARLRPTPKVMNQMLLKMRRESLTANVETVRKIWSKSFSLLSGKIQDRLKIKTLEFGEKGAVQTSAQEDITLFSPNIALSRSLLVGPASVFQANQTGTDINPAYDYSHLLTGLSATYLLNGNPDQRFTVIFDPTTHIFAIKGQYLVQQGGVNFGYRSDRNELSLGGNLKLGKGHMVTGSMLLSGSPEGLTHSYSIGYQYKAFSLTGGVSQEAGKLNWNAMVGFKVADF